MSQGSTVGSIQATDLLEALRALGADSTALCASIGLTETALRDPDARVPSSLLLALLERAVRRLRDPLVGLHAGARVQSRGPLFYLLLSSPRVSEGLQLLTRAARVPLDTQKLDVSVHDEVVDLTVDPGDPELQRSHHAVDYIVGANLSNLRRAIPGFRLLEVDLTHAEVSEPGETARTFGCPIRFRQPRNAMRFPDLTLDVVPAASNPTIAELINEFTSVRLELAQALLSNRVLKVEAVAQELGFEEPASFSKAFARWTGHTPSGYRQELYQSLGR